MQYFPDLKWYIYEYIFDRSLLTKLHYLLEADKFDAMNRQIILRSERKEYAGE